MNQSLLQQHNASHVASYIGNEAEAILHIIRHLIATCGNFDANTS